MLNAMAACPALHEAIHHDADKADHDCAVTMFAHGKLESATVEILPTIVSVSIETGILSRFSTFSPAIENLLSGRAPPSLV